jgi:hypothetical protein
MAERVGAAHDDLCAEATGHICVCSCRGTRHGEKHRGGRTALIKRAGEVTVMAVTHASEARLDIAGTDATTARQRAKHPVTVTIVQTDSPTAGAARAAAALGQTDRPEVTATVGPASSMPRDLTAVDDAELMQMFADLSEAGREDDLWHVWEEMGRREEAAKPARYEPSKPYADMSEDELVEAFGSASSMGDEDGIKAAYAEMDAREAATAARAEEARRPPAEPAYLDNPQAAWVNLYGSPIHGYGTSNAETMERARRAEKLALGLPEETTPLEVAAARRVDPRGSSEQQAWFLAWYRKLALAEGVDPNDRALFGAPDDHGAEQRVKARMAEHAAARQAAELEARTKADAKAARAAAIIAGPPGPAALRNPTVAYEDFTRHLDMYRGSPGVFEGQRRLEEARAHAFGLDPKTTSKQALDAAEKADPRSRPEKAATVVAWYRMLAEHDGVKPDGPEPWLTGPKDDAAGPPRLGYTPANVAKPWATWQEIRMQAKQDQANGDPSTWYRYTDAMRHAYGLPDDAVESEISRAYHVDPTTDNQAAALFITAFRELGDKAGIDPTDRLRYGPQDRGRKNRPTQWRESTPEQFKKIEALIGRGWDYLDAYADVHQVDAEELRKQQAGGVIDRAKGERVAEALTRMYDQHVHVAYVKAETALRGHMLSPAGKSAGIDPVTLFSGPTDRARKYASEELLRWWDATGSRMTFQQFRAQVTRDAKDVAGAKKTAARAQGKDFG